MTRHLTLPPGVIATVMIDAVGGLRAAPSVSAWRGALIIPRATCARLGVRPSLLNLAGFQP
jgi:hypothetical protein